VFANQKSLRIDQLPVDHSYLRFDLSKVNPADISSAQLRLYVLEPSTTGLLLRAVKDDTWQEATLKFTNAPAFSETFNGVPAPKKGAWITVDVTDYAKNPAGDGDNDDDDQNLPPENPPLMSIALVADSQDGVSLAAREMRQFAPQLVITIK
jgi:hypothetical protein